MKNVQKLGRMDVPLKDWRKDRDLEIMVTLLPSFPHFRQFVSDHRLFGIRLNSAMLTTFDLDKELALIPKDVRVPLYFDIKGRQLRITEIIDDPDYVTFVLNHPIRVDLPTPILFKAGADSALLTYLGKDADKSTKFVGPGWGTPDPEPLYSRLTVTQGPRFYLKPGESLHIRDASLKVGGSQFTDLELEKIQKVKKHGLVRWFLSYVTSQRDVDEFLELVGSHEEVILKIESKPRSMWTILSIRMQRESGQGTKRGAITLTSQAKTTVVALKKSRSAHERPTNIIEQPVLCNGLW